MRDIERPEQSSYQLEESDQNAKDWVINRMKEMDDTRADEEKKREEYEKSIQAKVPTSKDWKAQVNIPLEQVIREVYVGSLANLQYKVGKVNWKIEHDYTQIYEIVFDHMVDREKILQMRLRFESDKFTYWTGIFYSWVWFEVKHIYNWNGKEFFNKEAATKKHEIRHIGIKNVEIRKAWFDENAKKYDDCIDCIMEEEIPRREFKMRYEGDDRFSNIDLVWISRDDNKTSSSTQQQPVTKEVVKLRHYWNKIDGSYIILANEKIPIYNWVYTCKHGMLPLIPVQHYYRHDSIYWVSGPERLKTVRPYINSMLKVALDGSWLNASPAMITDNLVEVDGDLYLEAGVLNELSMSGDSKQIWQFQTNINVGQLVEILKLMEDYGMVTTWLNFKAPYTSPAKTAFETAKMAEEQNSRAKPVLQLDYEWWNTALSIMLVNTVDFAPRALAEYLVWEDEDGEENQPERYKIAVEDKKIELKDGKHYITDDVWYIEELQLKPELFVHGNWLRIKITTPYTTTPLNALKIEQLNQYLQQKIWLVQVTWDTQFLWDPKELNEQIDEVYWFDTDDMRIKTKADERREERAQTQEVLSQIQASLAPLQTQWQNAQTAVQNSQQQGVPEAATPQWGATIIQ